MSLRRLLAILLAFLLAVPLVAAGDDDDDDEEDDDVETRAKIKNKLPTVVSAEVTDDDAGEPGAQVSPVPGSDRTVSLSVVTEDRNGGHDVESVSVQVERPDGSVLVASLGLTEGTVDGLFRTFGGSFTVGHHETSGTYSIEITATDRKGATGAGSSSFAYLDLLAFAVSPQVVDFAAGELEPGERSPTASVDVLNQGNVELDVRVSGTDMQATGFEASIAAGRVKYSSDSGMDGEVGLGPSAYTDLDFDLAPGPSAARRAFFAVDVPSGEEQYIPAASYTGEITIGAEVSG